MTPEAALEMQIERYRQMTGDEGLQLGLRLHGSLMKVARDGIPSQPSGISAAAVAEKPHERIRLSHAMTK